jgi:hypothetical protein
LRYRLRFHLQEVDLGGDEVVVGRGSMCQVTIDDPMLSRRHLRIDLSGSEPTIEDLKSRNGTQLNGRPLSGRATLRDGDRIRIGTQELVFLVPSRGKKNFRTTSGLTFCVGCAVPFPSASPQCPHCGAVATVQGELISPREVAATGWTFHLLSQVVGRAIEQGRLADAERMMSRGVTELEEQLARGVEVEPAHILGIAERAARLGCALRTPRWLEVSAKLYGRAEAPVSRDVLALLDELPTDPRLDHAVNALRCAGPETLRAS